VEGDAETESHKHWPIGHLQSGCNVPAVELDP
jgi:hypothetical protein